MYDAVADPYCYTGTSLLRNLPDLRDQAALDAFEAVSTTQRSDEPLPNGRLSLTHYRAIHHHLFQDVFAWAGKFRTTRISKDGSAFCYPENIPREMKNLFSDLKRRNYLCGLSHEDFVASAAHFLATSTQFTPFERETGVPKQVSMPSSPIRLIILSISKNSFPDDLWRQWWRASTETNIRSSRNLES